MPGVEKLRHLAVPQLLSLSMLLPGELLSYSVTPPDPYL